jgi:transcriptional regulator PpsR
MKLLSGRSVHYRSAWEVGESQSKGRKRWRAMNVADRRNPQDLKFRRQAMAGLPAGMAEHVIAASNDVVIVLDKGGVILDLAIGSDALRDEGLDSWLDKSWADTVTSESRPKIEELLSEARSGGQTRWREINHPTAIGDGLAVRYSAIGAGKSGIIVAMGRDHRPAATMQQRLVQAQQSLERDYSRLRDTEARYRLLFQMSTEAVIIVDAASRRISDANPAADKLIGADAALVGKPFARLFAVQSQEAATSLLSVAHANASGAGARARLTANGRDFQVSASVFRQDRASHYLIRLAPVDRKEPAMSEQAGLLLDVLEQMPDAFVITDEAMGVIAHNSAFLDLVGLASPEQAAGQSLDRFIGRPGIDRGILMELLRAHRLVRSYHTIVRNPLAGQEEVELSAVAVADSAVPCYGFTLRSIARRPQERTKPGLDLPQTPAEMQALVGRVSLKEIVRDTTDLVEKMCIEAALELTSNNRASAAELLGLSRQSLYSKLHRFGLASADEE